MQLAQIAEMKIAASVEPGDYIDLAGVKYAVIENVPSTFESGKRHLTLTNASTTFSSINDRIFIIVPFAVPMTTYQM